MQLQSGDIFDRHRATFVHFSIYKRKVLTAASLYIITCALITVFLAKLDLTNEPQLHSSN